MVNLVIFSYSLVSLQYLSYPRTGSPSPDETFTVENVLS
jgi:hypothetical protein